METTITGYLVHNTFSVVTGGASVAGARIIVFMSTLDSALDEALCLGCGYSLRGLPGVICPECGRAFDPNDPSTYDLAGRSRRRRRIKYVALSIVLVGLLYGLVPRGLLRANIKMTCSACGITTTVSRWQLKPPPWLPFRYPGKSRTISTPANVTSYVGPCNQHQFAVSVQSDLHCTGSFTATTSFAEGERHTYNGVQVALDTLPDVLYKLLARDNNGIGP